jgi:Flp pilus assembly protein TadB
MHVALDVLFVVALGAAYCAQALRWLRVLQREHYEASAMARFVGRWASPTISAVSKNKVRLEQADRSVRTAAPDEFQGAPRYLRDRLRPQREPGVRRPISASQVLILAFVAALFFKNEAVLVAVAAIYGLFMPCGRVERSRPPSSRRWCHSPSPSRDWPSLDRGSRPPWWSGPSH